MALKFGRKKSRGPGDPTIKVGTSLKIRGTVSYATGKLPQRPSSQPPRDYTKPKNWMFSTTKPKAKTTLKQGLGAAVVSGATMARPRKPKKHIKYKKDGKVIGTSKYKQGEGQVGVRERFKRDK